METLLQIGETFELKSGELATVIAIENDDNDLPELKPLRGVFEISPIQYIVEIIGREGKFRMNENDVKRLLSIENHKHELTQEELDKISEDFDIDQFMSDLRDVKDDDEYK